MRSNDMTARIQGESSFQTVDAVIPGWIGTNTDIHERKLAEVESSRDRDRMWSLSQELMLVFDFNGIITVSNPAITRICGWGEDELVGQPLMHFLHPDDVARTVSEITRVAQGTSTTGFEARCRNKDGSYSVIDWAAVPEAGRIHAVGRDITSERAALREIERSWILSPIVKAVATMAGEILAVNPAWTNVLGWTEADCVGRDIMEFVAPEDAGAAAGAMMPQADGIPVVDFQNSIATKSGQRRRISWTIVPEAGKLYAFGRDVTAEQEAGAALAASLAERERIWASTNDLMGTGDVGGCCLKSVNPAWGRLLGYTDDQLLSQPFTVFADEADHAVISEAMERLALGEAIRDIETRLIHADGKRSLISWAAEPFGDIVYMVGRNVTEQRAAEDALRQSHKMEAVGQLTGGIAHDFNNLLQGITGSLDLLQKRIAQGRVGELDRFIAGAMDAANRAAALTHRLLAFSRRQPLDPRPVRANPLIASMEDLLRRTMGEQIELELMLDNGLWLTLCDSNQLENAVLNLAINARDAMPEGGRLTIETVNSHDTYADRKHGVPPGPYVCISVTDTGMGMCRETMDKAFEPFFTTKPIGQGTGLGLSMIYGFVRQSEGYTKIYSEPGKGTTVKLLLPRYKGTMEKEADAVTRPAALAADGETVLVVEDDSIVRELIVEVLNDLGYAALEAADGSAGLEILQSGRRIDLLISDIGLPGLNGRQVADAARLLRPELKVLFMTGYAKNTAFTSGLLDSGMEMITKPFAMEALAARIRNIIEEQ
jgi:PAS domain S-box-containing protein